MQDNTSSLAPFAGMRACICAPGFYLSDDACLPQPQPPAYIEYLTSPLYIGLGALALVLCSWLGYAFVGLLL